MTVACVEFGMSIIQLGDDYSEGNEYMWWQSNVVRRIYEVSLTMIVKGMRYRLSKLCAPINENLTG
jgi:hypothetical protein